MRGKSGYKVHFNIILKPDKRAYTSIVPDIIGPVATTKLKHPPECPGIKTNAIWESLRQRSTPTVVYPFAMEFFHIFIHVHTDKYSLAEEVSLAVLLFLKVQNQNSNFKKRSHLLHGRYVIVN